MPVAEQYIQYVRERTIKEPEKSWDKILLGFRMNSLRMHFFPNRKLARGYQKLEEMMMKHVADSLSRPHSYVWGNIFAPCELVNAFGLRLLSIESLACYLSGYHLEDFFIDFAQSIGLAPTLCSYHKAFVGAVESGVVPTPAYAVTTSLSCDGNLNTFRFLQKKNNVPFMLLDVPYTDDGDAIDYLAGQLEELVRDMENRLGCRFRIEKLKEALRIENETRKELNKLAEQLQVHYYPGAVIDQMYLMMATHLLMGTPEFLELIRFMNEDIQTHPEFTGKRILWIHLLPFYQESLNGYFNENEKYQIMATDIIVDYLGDLDTERPFYALAKKLIENVFNGSYGNKAKQICDFAGEVKPDAAIHFCHWGCKQAAGGSVMLKEAMRREGIPLLILDGDGIDKRNSHDGQIKTRLEAFLEMIGEGGAEA